ncbi:MAG TPA: Maf family protein [Clostridia bacterium]|nr:Maf family protein [Clostridia bacterium]
MPIILLASRSPRRRELLKNIVGEFDVMAPEADESEVRETPGETALAVAEAKLKAVPNPEGYDAVIVCDTLVYLDGVYYGKPKDEADAKRMLKELSGKTHTVVSGFIVWAKGKEVRQAVTSYVTFKKLSEPEIEDYVRTERPLDKAGSYGAQDGKLVEKIEGSYTNVVGLPVEALTDALAELKII